MPLGNPQIVVREWARVPRSCVDVDDLRNRLTVPNPAFKPGYQTKGVEQYLHFWSEVPSDPGGIYIPRNFKLSRLPLTRQLEAFYPEPTYPHVEWDLDVPFEPRDQVQVDALAALSAEVAHYQSGKLLVLNAGKGKSVLAARAAMTRPGPMLVVVDLHALVQQWKLRLAQAAGLEEDDIGMIQGPEGTWTWKGKKAVIALMQTLMSRQWYELDPELRSYFATAVFDEVHVAGAAKLGRAVTMFESERWGLTATPGRHDGQDLTLMMHVATRPCYVHLEQDLIPSIFFHYTGIIDPTTYIFGPGKKRDRWHSLRTLRKMDDAERSVLARSVKSWISSPEEIIRCADRGRKLSNPATISTIAEDRKRTKRISKFVQQLAEDENRKILVIGSRTEQLVLLHELHPNSGLVLGNVKKSERHEQIYGFNVVYAEQSLVSKGLDRPELDTLVVLQLDSKIVTLTEVPQSIGRVQRFLEGKLNPEVHYFIDENSSVIRRAEQALLTQLQKLFRKKLDISIIRWRPENERR